jgi:hypothetical protein
MDIRQGCGKEWHTPVDTGIYTEKTRKRMKEEKEHTYLYLQRTLRQLLNLRKEVRLSG